MLRINQVIGKKTADIKMLKTNRFVDFTNSLQIVKGPFKHENTKIAKKYKTVMIMQS